MTHRAHRSLEMMRAIVFCIAFLAPSIARAHTTLIKSEPAANAHLTESPPAIHLTFSEQVVPRLCQVTIVSAGGERFQLSVAGDPHNVRAIVGTPARLAAGSYTVEWRVLSADGHPATGSFGFVVGELQPAESTPNTQGAIAPAGLPIDSATLTQPTVVSIPTWLAALRGAGMAALLGATGLLLLALRGSADQSTQPRPRRYCEILTAAAAVFFVFHFIGWLAHTAPDGRLTSDWATAIIGTAPGMIEATRTLLVLVAAWALLIARRPGLALPPAVGAVAVSGAAGHAAAITPILSIPLKSVHLIAVSIWFGGLLWLVLSATLHTDFPGTCRRVSKVALLSVVAIAITGVVQALLIAPVGGLIVSPYGLVLGIKAVLFLILVAIGWYNRFRIMPEIDSEGGHERMRRSASRESTLMLLVLLVAGLLAYVPTPQP